ncbi:MAG: PLP-dependent transferase [Thermoplasmataceae archaeon]
MKEIRQEVKESIDPVTGSLTYPIYQTSAYRMPDGERYRYSREANPTVEELGRIISLLENTDSSTAFSSGMGAITTTLLTLLRPGMRLLVTRDCFARSFRFATEFLRKYGIIVSVSDPGNENVMSLAADADLIFLESISNPVLRVYDIPTISRIASEHGGKVLVDSTLATPVNQKPHDQGASAVIHSLSKFMSGHNDVIGGSVSGDADLITSVDSFRRTLGTSMEPNTAYLIIRGLKTLNVRMERINRSAMELARRLEEDPAFGMVRYPGLPSHPDSNVAGKLLRGFGGIISFDIKEDRTIPKEFMGRLKIIEPANTLGGVNTTISHPATMSHRSLSPDERRRVGFSESTFRLSVGLEDPDVIFDDIINALSGSGK